MARIKRRTDEDWSDEVRRLHRMRVAADLEVKAGERSSDWGRIVRASVDALNLLLVTSSDAEEEAVAGSSRILSDALIKGR